ncbi:flagellar biosynthetic protein FliO [Aliagarivorans taiwanensis]|uniref:flagellar biosynthetic protein FliO n=1 Tax=Aliagarivorans taiwanensis TaxID=561966 RepID=UPI0003F77F67|nr:flagellar biosynthetic protein FliO [Aliagarivorans taiwanensis]
MSLTTLVASGMLASSEAGSELSANSSPLDLLSLFLSLVVVLITIFVCAWVLKKTRVAQLGNGRMKVISQLALSAREKIVVVEVGEQQYLIGVTAQQVQLLDKLEQPLSVETAPSAVPNFGKHIQHFLAKGKS